MPSDTKKLTALLDTLDVFLAGTPSLTILKTEGGYALLAGDPVAPFVRGDHPTHLSDAIREAHTKMVEVAQGKYNAAEETARTAREEAERWAAIVANATAED